MTGAEGADAAVAVGTRSLAERYAVLVDRLALDEVAALFTEDGLLAVPPAPGGLENAVERRGREAVARALGSLERYVSTLHYIVGHAVGPSGSGGGEQPGSWRGITTSEAHHFRGRGDELVDRTLGLRYHDEYVASPEGWLFAARRLEVVWVSERAVDAARTRHGAWLGPTAGR